MIEYLEKLVEDGEHKKGLEYAERLLLDRDNGSREFVAIHCAILRCRFFLNEFHGALLSGQLAARLAEDLEEWDYYGMACYFLGVVWERLGQPELAQAACYNYISKRPQYREAAKYEVSTWYNLGVFHTQGNNGHEAVRALERALALAQSLSWGRHEHGIRQGLIQAYMRNGTIDRVPALLAKCLHYLRHNPSAPYHFESLLYHFKLRAEFAIYTNRLGRAFAVARRGMRYAGDSPEHQFNFHMVCAQIAVARNNLSEAIGYALVARVNAIQIRRFDLESSAAGFMYECTKTGDSGMAQGEFILPRLVDLAHNPVRHL